LPPGLLEAVRQIHVPGVLQIAKRGAKRLPRPAEALALVIAALGAADRITGVRTLNLEVNRKSLAIAIIEEARFTEDEEGYTVLDLIVDGDKTDA
jgi:hypothetical protein